MMHRPRIVLGIILLLSALLLASTQVRAQGPVQPPVTTYLQTWLVTITPNEIAANLDSGNLAVIDAGNSSIELLRPGGTRLGTLKGFKDPRSAAWLPGGVLLVGEAGSGSVKGYDAGGQVVLTLGSPHGEFQTPNDILRGGQRRRHRQGLPPL
jgi:hypothetical protein